MTEYRSVPSILLGEASEHFGEVPNVVKAVDFFRQQNPKLLRRQVKEFDAIIKSLNKERLEGPYPDSYRNVILLNQMIGAMPLPTLTELVLEHPQENVKPAHFTIEEIQQKINTHEWEFPHTVDNPEQLAAGLLIEGYGLDMVRRYKRPEVARQFVLAFEEILYDHFKLKRSSLKSAVLPWMVEERGDFSPNIQKELDLLTHVPRTLKEQMETMPSEEELQFAAASLTQEIRLALTTNHCFSYQVNARPKTRERIFEKAGDIKQWENRRPLPDLVAARIIVTDGNMIAASNAISWHWLRQPSDIWGRSVYRYIPGDGEHLINSYSDPEYEALHRFIIYQDPHGLHHIAEIQIMTPEQYETYKRTRPGYEERRKKRKNKI